MPLTEKELQDIHNQSEALYPYPDDKSDTANLRLQEMKRRVFFSAVIKERERAKVLIDALKKIKDPIAAMRENLKEGEKLNGYEAIRLSNNADYLKEIASNTLKQYNHE